MSSKRAYSVDVNLNKYGKASVHSSEKSSTTLYSGSLPHIVETYRVYSKIERQAGDLQERVNQYIFQQEIGCGAYGRVVKCLNERDGLLYACKILSKSKLKSKFRSIPRNVSLSEGKPTSLEDYRLSLVKREIAILKKLSNHPNINSLIEVVDDPREDNLYMIFELCERSLMKLELFCITTPYSEEIAWAYFRDISQGLDYLHQRKVVHRDIKPDNLLITFDNRIQIADFGISNMFEDHNREHSVCHGNTSMIFAAPESDKGDSTFEHGIGMDIWALGVTLFCMLHGHPPFEDRYPLALFAKIATNDILISENLSESVKDLLMRLLTKDARSRITLADVKCHPWVTKDGEIPLESYVVEDSHEVTREEVENAFTPAFMIVVEKFLSMFKVFAGSSVNLKRPQTMDDLSAQAMWKSTGWRSSMKIAPSCDALHISISESAPNKKLSLPKERFILDEGFKSLGLNVR
jgi:serine/threonine protein kinase